MTTKTLAIAATEVATAEASEGNISVIILITGLVVVFAALLLLIGIIKLYSTIVSAALNKGKKNKASKASKAPKAQNSVVFVPKSVSQAPADEVDLQTVAVISAAVEAYFGEEKKVRVVSVKRAPAVRSQWATAGVMQNISARRGF